MLTYAQRVELDRLAKRMSQRRFARSQLGIAIRNGKLVREPCYCGETKVQGHHPDYSKPLEVIWACSKHHAMLDKMEREDEAHRDTGIVIH